MISWEGKSRISTVLINHSLIEENRNDAPSGLSLDISGLTGINALTSFTTSSGGATSPVAGTNNTITPISGRQAAVTFGAGVSTQSLNDILNKSGLFTIGAAHGVCN